MLGRVKVRTVTAFGMVTADNVWADIVGVVEENRKGHHDETVHNGRDSNCHISLAHSVADGQGRWVETVENPEDDLQIEHVNQAQQDDSESLMARVTCRHEKIDSDHQLESEQLGQWLVADQF